ncbi:MAG: hypothetical protein ACLFT3_13410 [Cyclobacteriaceae bacterium]
MSLRKFRPELRLLPLFILLLGMSTSCHEIIGEIKDELDKKQSKPLPETVTIDQAALYPEGVEFYEKGKFFLVSSLTQGTIGRVSENRAYQPYIEDDDFVSTIGIHIDDPTDRLLICNSNPNTAELAELIVYQLPQRKELFTVTLSELFAPDQPHFANDVTTDEAGNAYVTDSFSPYIYKVDREGNAEVFFFDEAFATGAGNFGFNGIDYHPDGYLIVAFSATNSLYKIPVDDPAAITEIGLDTELAGPDGLYLSEDNETLIVVNNAGGVAPGKVLALESDNEWLSAELEGEFITGETFPTTAVQRQDKFYVLYAYLNVLFTPGGAPQEEYRIQKVNF